MINKQLIDLLRDPCRLLLCAAHPLVWCTPSHLSRGFAIVPHALLTLETIPHGFASQQSVALRYPRGVRVGGPECRGLSADDILHRPSAPSNTTGECSCLRLAHAPPLQHMAHHHGPKNVRRPLVQCRVRTLTQRLTDPHARRRLRRGLRGDGSLPVLSYFPSLSMRRPGGTDRLANSLSSGCSSWSATTFTS